MTGSIDASLLDRARALPLRARLIAILLSLLLVTLALTGGATAYLMNRDLVGRVDDNLVKSAQSVASSAFNQIFNERSTIRLPSGYALILFPTSGDTTPYAIPATDVGAVPDIPSMPLDDPRVLSGRPFSAGTADSTLRWRVVAMSFSDGSGTYVVAQPLDDVHETVFRFVLMTTLIGLGMVGLCALLGWAAMRRAFRPLTQIEDTAAAIAAGDLSRRIPDKVMPEEVASLSASLNGMLSHIEESFSAREASEDRMRQFVADASHELRTPLATVRGYAELYRQGAVPADAVGSAMTRIEGEAARMTGLVDDLLLLARLDEQRPLEKRMVDLTVVAADEVQAAQVRDPERRITLQGKDSHLGTVMIEGEESGLHQVLGNLLTNAIRHTAPGTPIEVAVGTSDGGHAVVEVRDHGSGIDKATATKVFERFFRADPARSRAKGGTGLGLAIVAAIVARHDGRVGILETPGGGATFVVQFPTAKSQVGPSTP